VPGDAVHRPQVDRGADDVLDDVVAALGAREEEDPAEQRGEDRELPRAPPPSRRLCY